MLVNGLDAPKEISIPMNEPTFLDRILFPQGLEAQACECKTLDTR